MAAVFDSTQSSRVAICRTPAGTFQYRGVRLRDGATLTIPATASAGGFVADNDGISYLVTASSLTVRAGRGLIREEPMLDFHGSVAPPQAAPAAPAPTTRPAVPLPPPLAAEVGGS